MSRPDLTAAFPAGPLRAAGAVALESIDGAATTVEPLVRGNRKRTVIVRFVDRRPVVVQVCREREWLRTEATLLAAIRKRTDVPVPPVLAAGTHGGAAYMVSAYVPGDDLHERFGSLGAGMRGDVARWFGSTLARLHGAFRFDGYGTLTRSSGELVATNGDWETWFHGYATGAVDRLPAGFDPLREELTAAVTNVPEADPAARLFPWDFRPGNALFADGSITAVLDWEAPLAAPPALSMAKAEYLVADWYVDDPAPLRRAFRDGYASVREYPSIPTAYRIAAVADSAVDSSGTVTNPRYPPVGEEVAVSFHREALWRLLG
ncbi:phosphotransferase family protein [Halorubrum vacuolatum]|uniref:Predicted kinase, aminoglycoside phosphotransferase (APT) family n=1 Tax=Halorubrum vacuolatum TaxID=63740 RepID=A0A238WAV6_HALVU|nr:phosphotransferase [Halorubrum vacuolatum]SNR43343.1 Predicted kinase, aminoglycoside phosphotransferase (APT) family [Halorubrum vacuolatum]